MLMIRQSTNPWSYLKKGVDTVTDGASRNLISSIVKILSYIGVVGCVLFLIVAIISYTGSSKAQRRSEQKDTIFFKLLILAMIFGAVGIMTGVYNILNSI